MLLDTSGLFCYHHKDELQHEDALKLFDGASSKLTHSYVLAEFVPLCQSRKLNRVDALMFVQDLVDNPLVEVVWVGEALGCTPLVRQKVKTLAYQVEKSSCLRLIVLSQSAAVG